MIRVTNLRSVDLSLDEYLSWRQLDIAVSFRLSGGDPVVLSMSINGHDAEAMYLRAPADIVEVAAGCWFAAETLGVKSTIEINPGNYIEKLAPADWRPQPRSPKQG